MTGGYYEDTTELLEEGARGWTLTSPLPRQSYGIRVVSLDNRVLATGSIHRGRHNTRIKVCFDTTGGFSGSRGGGIYYDSILELNTTSLDWAQVGTMKTRRQSHGVSVVNFADIQDYCHV